MRTFSGRSAMPGLCHATPRLPTRLEHDDAAGLGKPSGSKRREAGAGAQRECRPKLRVEREHMPVVAGISHQQDELLDPEVASLRMCSPFERLDVVEMRLGLNQG